MAHHKIRMMFSFYFVVLVSVIGIFFLLFMMWFIGFGIGYI
jgi:hypothetical protein